MEFPGSASGIDQIPQVSVVHASSSLTDDDVDHFGNVAPTLLLLHTVSKHEMGTKKEVEADVVDDAITAILPATPATGAGPQEGLQEVPSDFRCLLGCAFSSPSREATLQHFQQCKFPKDSSTVGARVEPGKSSKLTCPRPNCPYTTDKSKRLDAHEELHDAKDRGAAGIFSCMNESCAYLTLSAVAYYAHIATHGVSAPPAAPGESVIFCSTANCTFKTNRLKRMTDHELAHAAFKRGDKSVISCSECAFVGSSGSVRSHMQVKHAGERVCPEVPSPRPPRAFPCSILNCPYETDRATRMDSHMGLHAAVSRGDKGVLECDKCAYVTASFSVLNSHRSFDHAGPDPELFRDSVDPTSGLFECTAMLGCGFTSRDRKQMSRHDVLHSNGDALTCVAGESCGYLTLSSGSLARHNAEMHGGGRGFACEWIKCTFSAEKKETLETHWRTHDWRCACGSRFAHPLNGKDEEDHSKTAKHQTFLRNQRQEGAGGEAGKAGADPRAKKTTEPCRESPTVPLPAERTLSRHDVVGKIETIDESVIDDDDDRKACPLCSKALTAERPLLCAECDRLAVQWTQRYYRNLHDDSPTVQCSKCPALFVHNMAVKSHSAKMPDCARKVPFYFKHFPNENVAYSLPPLTPLPRPHSKQPRSVVEKSKDDEDDSDDRETSTQGVSRPLKRSRSELAAVAAPRAPASDASRDEFITVLKQLAKDGVISSAELIKGISDFVRTAT